MKTPSRNPPYARSRVEEIVYLLEEKSHGNSCLSDHTIERLMDELVLIDLGERKEYSAVTFNTNLLFTAYRKEIHPETANRFLRGFAIRMNSKVYGRGWNKKGRDHASLVLKASCGGEHGFLHYHGVIGLPNRKPEAEVGLVEQSFRKFFKSGSMTMSPIHDPVGWGRYSNSIWQTSNALEIHNGLFSFA